MTEAIRKYCRRCNTCQRNKADTRRVKGLYQPLPVPNRPWEDIHIDFVTELPDNDGHTTIMTVVDRFSKMVELVPLRNTTAVDVARAFHDRVICAHGTPLTITSDRDPRFTGGFWKRIMEQLQTKLQFSTTYHP